MSEFFDLFIEYMNTNQIFGYGVILFYGLLIGSFLNVVIYRLPIMMTNEYLNIVKDITELPDDIITSKMSEEEKKEYLEVRRQKDINIAFPSSTCGKCGSKIKIWNNIPVISYLMLGGKCASCETSYSSRYLFVELLVGLFFCFSFYMLGTSFEFIMLTTLFTGLLASAAIDLEHRILPDSITFGGLFLGLYYNTVSNHAFVSPELAITGSVFGFLGIYSFVKLYEKIRGLTIAMGEGDLKLYAMAGAWVGTYDLVFLIVLSTIIGILQFILLIPFKKKLKEYKLPFGPAIIMSLFIFLYFNDYVHQFF